MNTEEHGGACCGMTHVYGFPHIPSKQALNVMLQIISDRVYFLEGEKADYYYENNIEIPWKIFGHCIEVVLTDSQMANQGWAPLLKGKGFKLCDRWFNDNSGNYCNLLTYKTKEPETPAPYEW